MPTQDDISRLVKVAFSNARSFKGSSNMVTAASMKTSVELWATESLIAARQAYKNITINMAENSGFRVDWEGKPSYDARCASILEDRLATAARNLADLLMETL
jgi:hypothetical protein